MVGARKFCTKLATITRRNPITEVIDTVVSGIAVTPLWPAENTTITRLELNSPRAVKECYHVPAAGASLPAIDDGDRITHDGDEYAIIFAGEWDDSKIPCLHIVVDKIWGT